MKHNLKPPMKAPQMMMFILPLPNESVQSLKQSSQAQQDLSCLKNAVILNCHS